MIHILMIILTDCDVKMKGVKQLVPYYCITYKLLLMVKYRLKKSFVVVLILSLKEKDHGCCIITFLFYK